MGLPMAFGRLIVPVAMKAIDDPFPASVPASRPPSSGRRPCLADAHGESRVDIQHLSSHAQRLQPQGRSLEREFPKLALSQLTLIRMPFEEAILTFRSEGFRSIGLWRPRLADFGEERAALLLNESGMSVSSLSFAGGFTGSHGYRYTEAINDGFDALRQASIVGAETVVLVAGGLNGHITKHARRNVVDGIKALSERAEQLGVQLALRPMRRTFHHTWSFLNTCDETIDILDKIQCPNVRLAIDLYHCGLDLDWRKSLRHIAPYTSLVFVNDLPSPHSTEYEMCLPGEGMLPIRSILEEMVIGGFEGKFEVHVWSEKLWELPPRRLFAGVRESMAKVWPAAWENWARMYRHLPPGSDSLPPPRIQPAE